MTDRLSVVGEPPAAAEAPSGDPEGSLASALRDRYEAERLRAENSSLGEARRELLETLELRTRRISQLLGERDQLERQLVRAERALQEANRELGALTPRPETAPVARPLALWPTLRGLLLRLWRRGPAAKPAQREPARSGRPPTQGRSAPLIAFADGGERRPVIVVVAVGLEPDQRTRVLDIALRSGRERAVQPVVLTDDDDFAPLRERGLVFEYSPPRSVREAFAPRLEWELYLQRRLALIRRKWRPVRVIAFGEAAADLVRLWSDSPFEDPTLGPLPAAQGPTGPGPTGTGRASPCDAPRIGRPDVQAPSEPSSNAIGR